MHLGVFFPSIIPHNAHIHVSLTHTHTYTLQTHAAVTRIQQLIVADFQLCQVVVSSRHKNAKLSLPAVFCFDRKASLTAEVL